MGVGGGGVEKSRLQLTSAIVEVEVEAELGNISNLIFAMKLAHSLQI